MVHRDLKLAIARSASAELVTNCIGSPAAEVMLVDEVEFDDEDEKFDDEEEFDEELFWPNTSISGEYRTVPLI